MAVNVAEEFGRRLSLVRAQDAEKVEWMNVRMIRAISTSRHIIVS
jgi:hypothetical protein